VQKKIAEVIQALEALGIHKRLQKLEKKASNVYISSGGGSGGTSSVKAGVNSLVVDEQTLSGDITLTAGSNITLTAGVGEVTIASTGGATTQITQAGITFTGKYVRAKGGALASGDNTIYTCPAGKRAMIMQGVYWNKTVGSINAYPTLTSGATTYRLTTNTSVSNAQSATMATPFVIILEAGESIGVNASAANLAAFFRVIEYANTVPIFTAKLTTLVAGNNTVYTCPASTSAATLDTNLSTQAAGRAKYLNATGGTTPVVKWTSVTSGGSPSDDNQVSTQTTNPADATVTDIIFPATLQSGDYISVTSGVSTATQMAWVNIVEVAV
jgi:hypothetical protein